ncbi:hypothetical protein CPB83DRAFT_851194 [Crepidotus variabilis]|uniref:RRM domain-containing protein n=1 Tax=Crepidotus variabilis TaxID=179855 RepID=A0A9P6EJS1_9AGAR|nr:hypothetical protein CPB83DRAFT_851194 [Crepidotus variabilis]
MDPYDPHGSGSPIPIGRPHPYLHEPLLYITNLPPYVTDENLAMAFVNCGPFRPRIDRENAAPDGSGMLSGVVEFKFLERAEKALTTITSVPLPSSPPVPLVLSPYPPTTPPTPLPPPSALPRLVKQLPPGFTDSQLYDLFRPFGALASARAPSNPGSTAAGFGAPNGLGSLVGGGQLGPDTGLVEFWSEEDARVAEEAMHCAEVEGQNIAVVVWQPVRNVMGGHSPGAIGQHPGGHARQPSFGSSFVVAGGQYGPIGSASPSQQEFNANAPSFVPSMGYNPFQSPGYSPSPPRGSPYVGMSPVRSPVPIGSPLGNQSYSQGQGYGMHSPQGGHQSIQAPPSPFIHGPGQQVQLAPVSGPGSTSHSGLIDPCNLFIKNLSPEIDSNGLFAHFTKFGQIVSARVMRNESGESRGFGFVSYHQPDHANEALRVMNGSILGSKQIVVRLHEPKQLRQEKLAARFAGVGNGHPVHPRRSSSGATSPAMSDAGTGASPRVYSQTLSTMGVPGSPTPPGSGLSGMLSPKMMALTSGMSISGNGSNNGQSHARRGSGSYYTAALSNTLQIPLTYNSLSSLSPVVRREIMTGELTRRLTGSMITKEWGLGEKDIENFVESVVGGSLSGLIAFLEGGDDNVGPKLKDALEGWAGKSGFVKGQPKNEPEKEKEASTRPTSTHSTRSSSSSMANNPATASAPEHPSTPVSMDHTLLTTNTPPPRTSNSSPSHPVSPNTGTLSPSSILSPSSLSSTQSERERIRGAVQHHANELSEKKQKELEDLLMSLPKRERAMCLFSGEVMRVKIRDAKVVLEDDDELEDGVAAEPAAAPAAPATPKKPTEEIVEKEKTTPKTNDVPVPKPSPPAPAAAAAPTAPVPTTAAGAPTVPQTTYTLPLLARLPCAEIMRLSNSPALHTNASLAALLPTPDQALVTSTDTFIDSLLDKPIQAQKQALGEKLFKVVKGLGVKGAPKVTIALLDQEDLRALAMVMACWEPILKEKAGGVLRK